MDYFFFWSTLAFIVYTYLGYPLFLFFLSLISRKPVLKRYATALPFASVVIAAKNEEAAIVDRLENLLAQDYPGELIELIVVSDHSVDRTETLVKEAIDKNSTRSMTVKLFCLEEGNGKPAALNKGVSEAKGDIIVFADCRQRFSSDSIRELVANFADSTVGCVSGELIFLENSDSDIKVEMGIYWEYEKFIRKLESVTGSVVGATGAIYALRRDLFKPLPHEIILDDLLTPLNIVKQGKRVVFDDKAIAYDLVSSDIAGEWKRKTRTLAGNWQLFTHREMTADLFRGGLLGRIFSHKIFRLLVPFCLPLLLLASFWGNGLFYQAIFFIQIFCYLFAFLAYFFPTAQKVPGLSFIYFFCVLNLAAFVGWFRWVTGGIAKGWK